MSDVSKQGSLPTCLAAPINPWYMQAELYFAVNLLLHWHLRNHQCCKVKFLPWSDTEWAREPIVVSPSRPYACHIQSNYPASRLQAQVRYMVWQVQKPVVHVFEIWTGISQSRTKGVERILTQTNAYKTSTPCLHAVDQTNQIRVVFK